jgi:Tol biopolymer transport system component/serine/threonine protein kinase
MNELINKQIDHYRIDLLLGEGGMGAVYLAYDLNLEIPVALKLMHRHLGNQKEFQERFMQEARAAARLSHPTIVGVRYFGMSQGLLYMVMNFVPGDSLAGFLGRLEKTGQAVQLRETLLLIAQVADALGYAHQQGVIHRDIKPTNVMVQKLGKPDREGELALRAIVTDFGLAKLLIGGVDTQSGTFLGTLPYMSPEQCLSKPLDGRSDIYSLGVMLYQLTTGQLPFDIKTPSDAVMKHLNEIPPAPRLIWPGLPASVEAITQKAIAKRPEDRFQHAEMLADELRQAAKQLTEAEVTNYIASRTVLNLETSFQPVSSFPEPSRMGFDLPPAPTGDRLIIAQKDHTPRSFPLKKMQLTIGRTSENDIVLDDPDISRQHARLERTSGGWQVTDLGSTNGTYLGKVKLLAAIPEGFLPHLTLRMGPFFIHLQRSEAGAAQSSRLFASQVSQFQSRSGKIGLNIQPTKLEIMAGARAQVEVKLFNEDEMVDHLRLRVQGLPSAWVTISESVAELMPHQTALRTFDIHPPQDSSAKAGSHSYQVVVESEAKPGEKATASCEVVVKPFERFSVQLHPTQLAADGTTRVTIRNEGNADATYSLSGRDPANAIQFSGEHGRIRVPAHGSSVQEVMVRARNRPTFGAAQALPFELQVRSTSQGQQVLAGQLKVTPLVPMWIVPSVGILMAACLTLAGYFFGGRLTPPPTETNVVANTAIVLPSDTQGIPPTNAPEPPTPDVNATGTQQAMMTQTQAALDANAIAATDAAETAQAASVTALQQAFNLTGTANAIGTETANAINTAQSDVDGDGLRYAKEIELGTDPTKADTDGDGLRDDLDPKPLEPQPPAGRIAFSSARDGDREIYVMNTDGSGPIRLTLRAGDDNRPSWSPNGTRIAFDTVRDGNWEIYVMNADGSGQTNLTHTPSNEFSPKWSPDGARIAFTSNRDGNFEIYTMNANGSGLTQLTSNIDTDTCPAWSPSGTKIAFISDRNSTRGLYVMNVDGSGQVNLTNNLSIDDGCPSWSPDGTRIAYGSNRDGNDEIYMMNADGSAVTRLTANPGRDWGPASWSRDGKWLAFLSERDGNWEVYLMSVDGTVQLNLSKNSAYDAYPAWLP